MLLCVKKYCDSVSTHFGGKLFYGKINLEENEIVPARITNPIIPGESVDMKTMMLDIKLILNEVYLCRTFNNIKKGEESYLSSFKRVLQQLLYDQS